MKGKYSLLFLVSLFSLASCGNVETSKAEFIFEDFSVDFHTDFQNTYFIDKTFDEIYSDIYYGKAEKPVRGTDYSAPKGIDISWSVKTDKGSLSSYKVYVSEKEDLSDAIEIKTKKKSANFNNVKMNTTYYYKITSGRFESEVNSFTTTSKGPRNLYVDGVRNVRDLGGYGYIKQGFVYRGGAFESFPKNSDVVVTNITNNGIKTIQNELKIKTEIDLRKNKSSSGKPENCGLTESTISGVNYVSLPMVYENHSILEYVTDDYNDPARVKDFFDILADETNYPVYFHCEYGKDRTGNLAYVLEALLGMDNEALFRDYLFSNFGSILDYNLTPTGITGNVGKTLDDYLLGEELSLAEKTYRYLNEEIGVSQENLDSVIDILKV